MQKKIGSILAGTLILGLLAGCHTPAITAAPQGRLTTRQVTERPAAQPAKAAPAVSVRPAEAKSEQAPEAESQALDQELNEDLDAIDILADEGYQVLGLRDFLKRHGKSAWSKLDRAVRHRIVLRRQAKRQIVKAKAYHQAIKKAFKQAPWTDNGDGTLSKAIALKLSVEVNGQMVERDVTSTITVDAEARALVKAHTAIKESYRAGGTAVATHDKALQEDGSYLVTFHSERTYPNGATRTADITKTVSPDGAVEGQRTIVWTDKDGRVISTKTTRIEAGAEPEAPIEEEVSAEEPVASPEA